MRIEYDPDRNLLYLYFADPQKKSAETVTVKSGVHADFDKDGKLIGIDASEIMDRKIEFTFPKITAA